MDNTGRERRQADFSNCPQSSYDRHEFTIGLLHQLLDVRSKSQIAHAAVKNCPVVFVRSSNQSSRDQLRKGKRDHETTLRAKLQIANKAYSSLIPTVVSDLMDALKSYLDAAGQTFLHASNAAIWVLISFQIEQVLQKERAAIRYHLKSSI